MAKVNEKTETATILNGVVLTEKAVKAMVSLQEGNNEMLNDTVRIISDAVCFIAQNLEDMPKCDVDNAHLLMNELALIRNNLKDLRKP